MARLSEIQTEGQRTRPTPSIRIEQWSSMGPISLVSEFIIDGQAAHRLESLDCLISRDFRPAPNRLC